MRRGWIRDYGSAAAALLGLLPLAALLTGCVSSAPLADPVPAPLIGRMSASPVSGRLPLTVSFDCTGSSGGYLPLTADYDFDGDGVFDLTSAPLTASHTYTTAGSYSPRVRIQQARGGAYSIPAVENLISVLPSGSRFPEASLSASTASGNAPLTVSLDASASSDPDGSILRYDWDFNSDGIWDAYDSGSQLNWTYTAHGSYNVLVRVTDNDGNQDIAQLTVAVNAAPVAVITPSAVTAAPGSTISFDASGSSDTDGNIVRYEWDADGNGSFEQNTGTVPQLQILFPSAGSFSISLRVTDNSNATAIAVSEILIEN